LGDVQNQGNSMNNQLFMGNSLCQVNREGRMTLPASIRATLAHRTATRSFLISSHEVDACLVAFDGDRALELQADCHRRRIADEASAPHASHARHRRIFGFMVDVSVHDSGRFMLPRMLRCRAAISDCALVIGTGGAFEMWSPQVALQGDDPDLRALAAHLLEFQQAA
jgi:MraZ protein